MADSSCAKCGAGEFEAKAVTPVGADRELMLVQCAVCGGVVGALEAKDPAAMFRQQNAAMQSLAAGFGLSLDLEV